MDRKTTEVTVPGQFRSVVWYPGGPCKGPGTDTIIATPPVKTLVGELRTVDNALFMVQRRLERKVSLYRSSGKHKAARILERELEKIRRKVTDNGNGAFELDRFEVSDITCASKSAVKARGVCPISTYSMRDVTSIPYIQSLQQLQTATGVTLPTRATMRAIALGAASTAISNALPYQSRAELGTALLEVIPAAKLGNAEFEIPSLVGVQLRDAFKKRLPRSTKVKKVLGAAGSEYLNVMFGWLPTLGDVEDLLTSARDSAKLLQEFDRRYGKSTRFRDELLDERQTISRTISGTQFPTYAPLQSGVTNRVEISGTYRTRIWASGSFSILPLGSEDLTSDIRKWISQTDYLLGVGPDLEMVWEATPFSWLVDWQTNIGDVMKNASYIGKDGLVLNYAYSMMTSEIDVIARCGSLGGYPVQARFRGSRKVRVKGNPYGFSITPDSFSPKQWSIIAALGLSKAFGKL